MQVCPASEHYIIGVLIACVAHQPLDVLYKSITSIQASPLVLCNNMLLIYISCPMLRCEGSCSDLYTQEFHLLQELEEDMRMLAFALRSPELPKHKIWVETSPQHYETHTGDFDSQGIAVMCTCRVKLSQSATQGI